MQMINFTNCEFGNKSYSGANKKISIKYQGAKYLLKFQDKIPSDKRTMLNASYSNSAISEYLACKILQTLNLEVQEVLLGFYREKIVVACKDFNEQDYRLQEFAHISNNCIQTTSIGRIPKLQEIEHTVQEFPLFYGKETFILQNYWDIIVADAIIGNFDRHSGNWGYLVNEDTGEIKLAPIYDCGSSLYPQLADDSIENIIKNEQEIEKRMHEFPKPALLINDERKTYKELLSDTNNSYLPQSLLQVLSNLDAYKISKCIREIPCISENRKLFYHVILENRLERIILPALNQHQEKHYSKEFQNLIQHCKKQINILHDISQAIDKSINGNALEKNFAKATLQTTYSLHETKSTKDIIRNDYEER